MVEAVGFLFVALMMEQTLNGEEGCVGGVEREDQVMPCETLEVSRPLFILYKQSFDMN